MAIVVLSRVMQILWVLQVLWVLWVLWVLQILLVPRFFWHIITTASKLLNFKAAWMHVRDANRVWFLFAFFMEPTVSYRDGGMSTTISPAYKLQVDGGFLSDVHRMGACLTWMGNHGTVQGLARGVGKISSTPWMKPGHLTKPLDFRIF